MVISLPCLMCTQYTVNILQLVSNYALFRMISIITRIHNSTLLYGHILTMISTSTVERLYAQAYIRVYMYAHVTHSACLDFTRAYTVEYMVLKRTWVTFRSICIKWYLVGSNSNKIRFGPSNTDHQTILAATDRIPTQFSLGRTPITFVSNPT